MSFYFQFMKPIIMPFIITIMLLTITVGFWGGVPLFVMPVILYETGLPRFIQWLLICLSGGICFSIVCIPFVLSFAKAHALRRGGGMLNSFLISQSILIVFAAMLFAIFYSVVLLMAA